MTSTAARFHFSPRPNRASHIRWQTWGPPAFQEAAREGKPILLAISAVWCHWCHVMDETSYSDDEVIRLINEAFVPVRVDNDERPDINARYNQGGWPTTAFLTPEGEVLAGATYVPPEQMREVLVQVRDHYRHNREEIDRRVAEARERQRRAVEETGGSGELSGRIVEDVLAAVIDQYDPVYGGFGAEPKFPHVEAIDLLLHLHQRRRDPDLLHMARKTLQRMTRGGTYDQVWGGLFRYSTTRDWSVPHFEKMLEDNAGLLRCLLRLVRITGDAEQRQYAERTVTYLDTWLSDSETGVFFGSQDADEQFYTLDEEARRTQPAPFVDRRVYASWCAMAASAYLEASWTLDRPELAQRAVRALDWLWDHLRRPRHGMRHCWADGASQGPGLLADQAWMAQACLDAYEGTGERRHLDRALELADVMRQRFEDQRRGGFWDRAPDDGEALGRLALPQKPIGENAVAAIAFGRLSRVLVDGPLNDVARRTLAAFAGHERVLGLFAAGYALAVDRLLNPGPDVRIVASGDAGAALHAAALRVPASDRTVQRIDPAADRDILERVALPLKPAPAAYACAGTACSAPVTDAAGLTAALDALLATAEEPDAQPRAPSDNPR